MILERTTLGWLVYYKKDNNPHYLNTKQIKEILNSLNSYNFKDVYYTNYHNDLVIQLSKGNVIIKYYDSIKNRPYISNLNNKINMGLLRHATKNIKDIFMKQHTKFKTITLSVIQLLEPIELEKNIKSDNQVIINFVNNNLLKIDEHNKLNDIEYDVMEAIM